MVSLAPHTASSQHLWLQFPAHGGSGWGWLPGASSQQPCPSLHQASRAPNPPRARHVVLGRLLGGVPPWSAETSAVQARWPWTFRPSALLPAKLGAWRDESARAACQGVGPGLGREGSWWQLRPCDCRRLRVSQGTAGPPAHRWAQSEMASHDLAVGVCVLGVGEETGGRGSDFRIQAGNSKYICASRADMHPMTSLISLMQKLGFGRGHTHTHTQTTSRACCVQAVMADKDIRDAGDGGGVSHAARLHLPRVSKARTQTGLQLQSSPRALCM